MCLALKTVLRRYLIVVRCNLLVKKLVHRFCHTSINIISISLNEKCESYDSILMIVNLLTKIVYYKSVKIMINAPKQAKIIIDIVVHHHNIFKSILMD